MTNLTEASKKEKTLAARKKITPLKAIRKKCLDCAETMPDIVSCQFADCAIYPYRMGRGGGGKTLTRAIKAKCLWCMNGMEREIKLCTVPGCSLYPFRFGKNPNIKVSAVMSAKAPRFSKKATRGRVFNEIPPSRDAQDGGRQ